MMVHMETSFPIKHLEQTTTMQWRFCCQKDVSPSASLALVLQGKKSVLKLAESGQAILAIRPSPCGNMSYLYFYLSGQCSVSLSRD